MGATFQGVEVRASNGLIRVLVADSESLFRESIRDVLEETTEVEVIAEGTSHDDLAVEAARANPDVVMLDPDLPGPGVAATIALLRRRAPGTKVLIVTGGTEPGRLLEALQAGASGYLTKEAPVSELIQTIRRITRGEIAIPPALIGALLAALVRQISERNSTLERLARLTPREREVLLMLAEGKDRQVIAEDLFISPETVRTHFQNILVKLEVHSRLEAAAFAWQEEVWSALGGNGSPSMTHRSLATQGS